MAKSRKRKPSKPPLLAPREAVRIRVTEREFELLENVMGLAHNLAFQARYPELPQLLARLRREMFGVPQRVEALLETARASYGSDELEIDDDAAISEGADDGTWVQGWFWVYEDQVQDTLQLMKKGA